MTSPLICTVCGRPVDDCPCAETDARLRAVAYDAEGVVMIKWCRRCDKHYARCRCGTPEFFIICGGQDITADVAHGLPDLTGRIIAPDLRRP